MCGNSLLELSYKLSNMAKAKSKKITLEKALVPLEEQPYEVPENWCWIKLGVISSIISKGTTPKGGKSAYVDEGIDFLRVENINDDGTICHDDMMHVTEETHTGFLKRSILEENDILVSIAGTLGKTAIVKNDDLPLNTNQAVAFVRLKDNGEVSREYIRYAIDTPVIQNMLLSKTKVTAIPNLTLEIISECLIPFPPLAEQQRIVEQIESLFSKLDEAKEKAQEVIDGYEARNAAVYNDAFSGRLTAQWRKDNYKENKWETKRFDEVADIKSNLVEPSNYLEFPHIAPDNIEKRTGILLDYHTIAEDGVKSGKHRFYAGQILYSKIRPYLSKVVMVDFDGLCSADMYPIEAKENTKYLLYYMLSDMFLEQASSAGSRSVLPKINQKELSAIKVRITSDEEQKEVVRILDYLLPMMQQVRDKAVQVVDNIDTIKKSILAKAFRGELGTNIPEDESAIELLKIILNKGEC